MGGTSSSRLESLLPPTRRATWFALLALLCAGPGCSDESERAPNDAGNDASAGEGEPDAGAPGTWFPTSEEGAPEARGDHSAVWTGSEMIIYGGHGQNWRKDGPTPDFTSGGRYDPRTDSWRSMPSGPLPAPAYWTGSELLIVGSTYTVDRYVYEGALYDLESETWRPISLDGVPARSSTHLWVGTGLFLWGAPAQADARVGAGALYDPVTDTWSDVSQQGAPSPRSLASSVWTGQEVIVWGGTLVNDITEELGDGALYDPASDTWRAMAPGGPAGVALDIVWSGTEAIVLTQTDGEVVPFLYDPVADTWTVGAPASLLLVKTPVAWVRDRVLFWGGNSAHNLTEYDPRADVWTISRTLGAPHWNDGQSCLWTGTELILWGGEDGAYSASGSRFVPAD